MTEDDQTALPAPHPAFARHFTDPLYEDESGEFAPFGTDEGADALADLLERRDRVGPDATVRDLLRLVLQADPQSVWDALSAEEPDVFVAAHVIGVGFALIRLTGQIDGEGRSLVLQALERTRQFYAAEGEGEGEAELRRMTDDLRRFPAAAG